ncbi:MAG: N-(5'-phosphoribosyl)anthranilate isomerase [Alphaproteobacteria bacterium]
MAIRSHGTPVKICGITRLEDALVAAEAGVAAIGFIFWPPGKRYIAPSKAAEIVRALPAEIARVGVFLNEDPATIRAVRDGVGLTHVQLHGDESPDMAHALPGPVIKAFRGRIEQARLAAYRTLAGLLLEGYSEVAPGGTGTAADEMSAQLLAGDSKFILSGGLVAESVAIAIRRFNPAAVDVASGVETAPGIKDHDRIRAFIAACAPPSRNRAAIPGFSGVPD